MQLKNTFCFKLIVLLSFSNSSYAQKISYPIAAITPALSANADAVVRYDSTYTKVEMGNVQLTRKYAISILNTRGEKYAGFSEVYNSFSTINNIKGRLINAEGKQIKTLLKNKISDRSTFGATFSFHDDLRVKSYNFMHREYPYTVEYEYEVNLNSSAFLPGWLPQAGSRLAVEKAVFNLIYYKTDSINFRLYNLPDSSLKKNLAQGSHVYKTWVLSNIAAYTYEPYSGAATPFPCLRMMAKNFTLSGLKGNAENWESLGMFYYNLNKDRDSLPESSVRKFKEMTDTIPDTYGKIARLYSYLQANCRYVANEYGLAGWQTFKAEEVDKVGYGDCKGLSNYMKAMLQAINIPAYLVLINAGENGYRKSEAQFVNNSFNHMILCVPLEQDTVWLECTSTSLPAGYLGTFTSDRLALLLTEKGGVLTQTPAYHKEASYISQNVEVWLEPGKESNRVVWNTLYSGILQDDLLNIYKSNSANKRKVWQKQSLPFKSYELTKEAYDLQETKEKVPQIKEHLDILAEHLSNESGKRYTIDIPLNLDLMYNIDNGGTRTLPIEIDKDIRYAIEYKINLPDGYKVEALPENVNLDNRFVNMSYKVNITGNICTVNINFEQHKGIFDVAEYNSYLATSRKVKAALSSINLSMLK